MGNSGVFLVGERRSTMKRLGMLGTHVGVTCLCVAAAASAAVKEHPVIRPYPGAVLLEDYAEYSDHNSYEMPCFDADKKETTKTVSGKYWQLYYEIQDSNGERNEAISVADILENYKSAALEKGGNIEYENLHNGFLTFTLPREEGGLTWCYIEASPGHYGLWIIDEKDFEKKLTFSTAEQMKNTLDAEGHVAVYGILFDIDKAFLKLESIPPLQEIVKLLQQNASLKVEIQGHTDDQGSDEHNLALSDKRAKTVLQYLTLFGIAPERLTAKGYGETMPVASNDTPEGRAKNRRVELVKR
jgi:outer membrane protein OmpA-like peptidoglycan-associated protein